MSRWLGILFIVYALAVTAGVEFYRVPNERRDARAAGYAAAVDSVRAADTTAYLRERMGGAALAPLDALGTRPLPSCCGGCHGSWVTRYRLAGGAK